jgi:ABC-type antimicrobial peptide transport system permease subunit
MGESDAPTTGSWSSSSKFDWRGKDPDLSVDFPFVAISHDFGQTIGWQISQGRDFSREFISDSAAMIINESAANYMGFTSAVGEVITWGGQPMHVVGVVKDIIAGSPYEPVLPTIYYLKADAGNYLILRLNPEASAQESIAKIEAALRPHLGDQPFEFEFADEQYARKFQTEGRIGTLASIFSSLAIFISCLGTFGLSSFVAEQRTKEIGVRKVMGASRFQLWQLMSRELAVLVVVSCVIAVPVAYSVLSSWLAGYAYRTSIPAWTLIAATLGTMLITLATSSWHTLQAASMNPVKSLRTE